MLVMRNKFRKVEEHALELKNRSDRIYSLIGKFGKFLVNPRWPYQIFKSKKSSWSKIEELGRRR